ERSSTYQAATEDLRNLANSTRAGRLRRPALLPVHRRQTWHGPARRAPATVHHRPMAPARLGHRLKLNTYGDRGATRSGVRRTRHDRGVLPMRHPTTVLFGGAFPTR